MSRSVAWLTCLVTVLGYGLTQPANAAGTRNFSALDPMIAQAAEDARHQSAVFWTGRALPGDWSMPCPISVQAADHEGGGRTSFHFDRGEVSGWSMIIAGRRDALLADVVPHEVDHMVRASLVRRPIPRWLDEGCATLMESAISHRQYRERVQAYLGTTIDVAFLDAADYPADVPSLDRLYAVGFSLVEFLLSRSDPATLLAFQRDERLPSQKVALFFGLSLSELDAEWRAWAARRASSGLDCRTACCGRHGCEPGCFPLASSGNSRPGNGGTLTIYTSRWCGPCRRFWDDFRSDVSLRSRLESQFEIQVIDVDLRPDLARAQRIEGVPAFETASGRIDGYEGPEWLWKQLVPVSARPLPVPTTPAPVTAPPVRPASQPRPIVTGETPGWFGRLAGGLLRATLALSRWGEIIGIVGGTVATGGVGALAVAAAIALWRRRQRKRKALSESPAAPASPQGAGGAAEAVAPFPRALDEARQLVQLRQSEGRVAVLDALRGMLLNDELHKILSQASPAEAAGLIRLQTAIDARVNEIAPLSVRLEH